MDIQEEGLAELANWGQSVPVGSMESTTPEGEFMALDDRIRPTEEEEAQTVEGTLRQENAALKEQVAALQRLQRVSFMQLRSLREEKRIFLQQKQAADERHVEDQKAFHDTWERRNSSTNHPNLSEGEDQNPQKKRKLGNG
jgi:pre-rRNA-processing protein IPI3